MMAPNPDGVPEVKSCVHDEGLGYSTFENMLLTSWFGEASIERLSATHSKIVELADIFEKINIISILEAGAQPPNTEARKLLARQQNSVADCIECLAVLIPQEGFIPSINAIVIKTMQRTRRKPWQQCIKRNDTSAAKWLAEHSPFSEMQILKVIRTHRTQVIEECALFQKDRVAQIEPKKL